MAGNAQRTPRADMPRAFRRLIIFPWYHTFLSATYSDNGLFLKQLINGNVILRMRLFILASAKPFSTRDPGWSSVLPKFGEDYGFSFISYLSMKFLHSTGFCPEYYLRKTCRDGRSVRQWFPSTCSNAPRAV